MRNELMPRSVETFNGPVEIGLRALALLTEAYPATHSLQRLVVLDYLVVHSDDVPGGPIGLHPQTPHRGGELLVRRDMVKWGLMLLCSRGLAMRQYGEHGIQYGATETAGAFLDALHSSYTSHLRHRSQWLFESYGLLTDAEMATLVRENIGRWGAEFEMESVLYEEKDA